MKRRSVALAATVLVAALLFALIAGDQGVRGAQYPRAVRLMLQWKPQAEFAGFYVALEKGYYRDRDLDVTVLPGGPEIDPIACLRSGETDFATSFLCGALSASERGAPLVDICQVINRSNLMIVAHRDAVKTREDLNGARVSLWNNSSEAAILGFFHAAHVHPQLVPQYYTVNLFLRDGVDACAAMEYNEYHTIIESGVNPDELTTFFTRDLGFGFPEDGVFTLASTQRRDPAVCRDFAAATLEGWAYCKAHPDEAVDIVMQKTREAHVPTNREHQRWMLDHVLASIFPGENDSWQVGKLSRVDYERTRAIMIGERLIKHAPSYSRFVAPEARGAP